MVSSNQDDTGRSADDLPEPGCDEAEAVRRPFLAGVTARHDYPTRVRTKFVRKTGCVTPLPPPLPLGCEAEHVSQREPTEMVKGP